MACTLTGHFAAKNPEEPTPCCKQSDKAQLSIIRGAADFGSGSGSLLADRYSVGRPQASSLKLLVTSGRNQALVAFRLEFRVMDSNDSGYIC